MANKLASWNTKYSADSAEFCPIAPFQNIFVIGTYKLLEKKESSQPSSGGLDLIDKDLGAVGHQQTTQGPSEAELNVEPVKSEPSTRLGCLYVHRYDGAIAVELQVIDMSAILDMKWSCNRVNGCILLAAVTSVGEVIILKLNECKENPRLDLYSQYQIGDGSTLALSLDWCNRKIQSNNPMITVSDSKGDINIFELQQQKLTLKNHTSSHKFEAWITAFNYWNPSLVYSGGDDCKFIGYDIRCGLENTIFTNKEHGAGVTSLHSNDVREHLLASGSYDEIVRLWDTRHMRRSVRECCVSGGVWRLKWRPLSGDELITACMYNNFHVLRENEVCNGGGLEIIESYTEHESIAYGVDWSWQQGEETTIVSASFYDNFVSLWKF
uniref:methylated diphthine methylhydrolase n=1 Tax=Hirondellea gigas TaxID=1518452 RepID=A0A2P2IC08_9CRUS